MFAKIIIILFFILPHSLSFAAIPNSTDLKKHINNKPYDSGALYNLALDEQKVGNLAMSLALAERSFYLNPLNIDSLKLKKLASNKLENSNNEQIESIPMLFRIMDFIPYGFLLLLCLSFLLIFAFTLGSTFHEERISFKSKPKKRLQSALSAAALVFTVFLVFFKTHSQTQPWACVISSEASLYTGPSVSEFPQVSTLSSGNCSKMVLEKEAWISLDPSEKASGWTQKSQVLIVRGNKFDPLFKSD